ncbi:MAG: hypothetical protein ACYCZR_13940, partial [Burkholderiales bacterium]
MDNKRLVVFIIFSLSILLLWQKWQVAHTPEVHEAQKESVAPTPDAKLTEKPQASGQGAVDTSAELQKGQIISVRTDVMHAGI